MKDQEYWWHDELNKLFTRLTLLLSVESRRQMILETKTLRFLAGPSASFANSMMLFATERESRLKSFVPMWITT